MSVAWHWTCATPAAPVITAAQLGAGIGATPEPGAGSIAVACAVPVPRSSTPPPGASPDTTADTTGGVASTAKVRALPQPGRAPELGGTALSVAVHTTA